MPGKEVWFVDRNQDGPCEVYSVLCQKDDSFTRVSRVEDDHFLSGLGRSEDAEYTTLAVLRDGDLCFITESYSPLIDKRVKVRVTHDTAF